MIRGCPHCGRSNRIPPEHLGDAGRCGACKAPLRPLSEPLEVDPEEFRRIVDGAAVPVLVDFWAEWCGPCKMAAPEVRRAAEELSGKAVVLKVDTEKYPQLAGEFGVRGIPNFVLLNRGGVVHQHAGLVDHSRMKQWVEGLAR